MVMPASLMTGAHLSISAFRNVASSAGVDPTTTTPSCSSRSLVTASVRAAAVSACIFRMISGGVFAGAKSAYQDDTSKRGDAGLGERRQVRGCRCALGRRHPQGGQLAPLG